MTVEVAAEWWPARGDRPGVSLHGAAMRHPSNPATLALLGLLACGQTDPAAAPQGDTGTTGELAPADGHRAEALVAWAAARDTSADAPSGALLAATTALMAEATPTERGAPGGRVVRTLSHRADAADRLVTRIQASLPAQAGQPLPAARVRFGDGGRVADVSAVAPDGLLRLRPAESLESGLQRFLAEHGGLYDLPTGHARMGATAGLAKVSERTSTSPGGHTIRIGEFAQTWRGVPVLDGALQVEAWDDRIVRVGGTVVNPAEPLATGQPTLTPEEAVAAATAAAAADSLADGQAVRLEAFGVLLSEERLVWRAQAEPLDGGLALDEATREVLIDADSGDTLSLFELRADLPSEAATYRVYRPDPTQPDARDTTVADVSAYGTRDAQDNIYPWLDDLSTGWGADRSPVTVFDATQPWGSVVGFQYNRSGDTAFTSNPGSRRFKQQHTAYWAQRAAFVSDRNMQWWPPADPTFRSTEVAIVMNSSIGSQAWADGCRGPDNPWGGHGDAGASPMEHCINLSGTNGGTYPSGLSHATSLGVIFHEMGHIVDNKYLSGGTRGGTCERNSIREVMADLYVQMMFVHEFGTSADFTDYDSDNGNFSQVTLGVHSNTMQVHEDDGDLACYETPCSGHVHDYGLPLMQAVWESLHATDCEAGCVSRNDGADHDEARWALFHAFDTTGRNEGYDAFVDNFLRYYYYDVGYTAWANRWWIFNHHGLVGDAAYYGRKYGSLTGSCWE